MSPKRIAVVVIALFVACAGREESNHFEHAAGLYEKVWRVGESAIIGNYRDAVGDFKELVSASLSETSRSLQANHFEHEARLYEKAWRVGESAITGYYSNPVGDFKEPVSTTGRKESDHFEHAARLYEKAWRVGDFAMTGYYSEPVGDFKELVSTSLTSLSMAVGGSIGGSVGCSVGTAVGFAFGPFGAAVGGVVGSIAGRQLGSFAGSVVGPFLSNLADLIVDFFRRLFGYDGCCVALKQLEMPCGMMYHHSEAKIRKAYRRVALHHHPDKQQTDQGKDEANAAMIQINAALAKAIQCTPSHVDSWTDSVNEWVGKAGGVFVTLAAGQWSHVLNKQVLEFLKSKPYEEQMFDHMCTLLENNKPDDAKTWWEPFWTVVKLMVFGKTRCDLQAVDVGIEFSKTIWQQAQGMKGVRDEACRLISGLWRVR